MTILFPFRYILFIYMIAATYVRTAKWYYYGIRKSYCVVRNVSMINIILIITIKKKIINDNK